MSNVKSYVYMATDKSNVYKDTDDISSDKNLEVLLMIFLIKKIRPLPIFLAVKICQM